MLVLSIWAMYDKDDEDAGSTQSLGALVDKALDEFRD